MSFGNKEILMARFNNENNFIKDMPTEKITELGDEVSDIIYQFTSLLPPTDPMEAPASLRGIWTDIVLFKLIPYQKGISDDEKQRRKTLYQDAYSSLQKISSGNIPLKDNSGNIIGGRNVIQITGTKRINGII